MRRRGALPVRAGPPGSGFGSPRRPRARSPGRHSRSRPASQDTKLVSDRGRQPLAVVAGEDLCSRMGSDQPSMTMWWMVSTRRWRLPGMVISAARKVGWAARSHTGAAPAHSYSSCCSTSVSNATCCQAICGSTGSTWNRLAELHRRTVPPGSDGEPPRCARPRATGRVQIAGDGQPQLHGIDVIIGALGEGGLEQQSALQRGQREAHRRPRTGH